MHPSPSRLVWLLAASALWSCSTAVPPAAVRWDDAVSAFAPPANEPPDDSAAVGYLRVDTDTDVRVAGSLSYDNPHRPFDLYSPDGKLIRADIDNQGWRSGQDPVSFALPPGRYVIGSMYGSTYRKLQVEVRPGLTTEVSAAALGEAPRVFAN